MMASIESKLNALWYGKAPVPWYLRLLAKVYGGLLPLQAKPNKRALSVPVVVVGNFTVGGTGKTPLIIALVQFLQSQGFKPGVVSRGYGRVSKGARTVHSDSSAETVGDEPLLIARNTNAPVRVDTDRRAAAQSLIGMGCTVIVSDDGLQHRGLPRTVEIEVLDAARGYGNGRLLPAGPLREPVRPVHMQVLNGKSGDTGSCYGMSLVLGDCYNLKTHARKPLQEFVGQPVQAIAGIGNPERFFSALSDAGIRANGMAFADHHRFQSKDLPDGTVLMTEKDAVKITSGSRNDLWAVPVHAQLSAEFFQDFLRRVQ